MFSYVTKYSLLEALKKRSSSSPLPELKLQHLKPCMGPKAQISTISKKLVLKFSSYVKKDVITSVGLVDQLVLKLGGTLNAKFRLNKKSHSQIGCSKAEPQCQTRALKALNLSLARSSNSSKRQNLTQRAGLITVIRSPFVFKKTREQFGQNLYSQVLTLQLSNWQQAWLLRSLSQLALPGELKIYANS